MVDQQQTQQVHMSGKALAALSDALGLGLSQTSIDAQLEQPEYLGLSTLQTVKTLLNNFNAKGIRGGVVTWQRFDRRQLPALVSYQGEWCLATNKANSDLVLLSKGEQALAEVDSNDLHNAPVLWLARVEVGQKEADDSKPKARQLILEALFKN
ncbi:MAG: ABC transporter ATP-binding protein, partial [Marinomonas sp.]